MEKVENKIIELQNAKKKNQLKAKNIGRVIKEEKKVEEEKNNSNEN